MKMKLAIALVLVVALALSVFGQALAQVRVSGVKSGDYFVYSMLSQWSSENASATVPPSLLDINNTEYFKATVEFVVGSNVTTNNLQRYANGTEDPSYTTQMLDTGGSYFPSSDIFINVFSSVVGANLVPNDLLHPLGNDSLIVNETISRSYPSGNRETNVVSGTYPLLNNESNVIGTGNDTYLIDKTTGVVVYSYRELSYINPTEHGAIEVTLKETNLWTVNSSSWLTDSPLTIPIIVGVTVAVIVVIAVFVFSKSRRRHKRRLKR